MEERLQKLIAGAGIASRRKAEELIAEGAVSVNGHVVTELGTKADPQRDHIKVHGKLINPALEQAEKVHYLLNKPKGYLSSMSDPDKRPLVTAFLPTNAPRVFPVGRLDFNTEGLLILTNDGDLANLITHPGGHCPKVYHVKVKGTPKEDQVAMLRRGVKIEGETYRITKLVALESEPGGNAWFEVTLHEGKNNQIRKMFDLIGHSVVKLRRVSIGHVTDRGLPVGAIRELTKAEVERFVQKAKAHAKAKAKAKTTAKDRKPADKPSSDEGTSAKKQVPSKASRQSFIDRKPKVRKKRTTAARKKNSGR